MKLGFFVAWGRGELSKRQLVSYFLRAFDPELFELFDALFFLPPDALTVLPLRPSL